MQKLKLRGEEIESVFELLGAKENDVSFSVGWALANSPSFLDAFLNLVVPPNTNLDTHAAQIRLQVHETQKGITDIEIEIPAYVFLIIEAKRGWTLPSVEQLKTYAQRKSFRTSSAPLKKLIALTECSQQYATAFLGFNQINGIPVVSLSWKQIFNCSHSAYTKGTHTEKRLLWELSTYLQRIMTMQKIESNLVYVVSLGSRNPPEWQIGWIDIIAKRRHYFHPVGKRGFPADPPNYLAFRYYGQLQSIHHVERYEIFTDPHTHFPEIPHDDWGPHYLYHLGPAFAPEKVVHTGNIYPSGRVWCSLDTLFTEGTISAARALTTKRMGW
ncbi:MAG: hypothetical protein ABSD46_09330 [Bacteroidota bacterium]